MNPVMDANAKFGLPDSWKVIESEDHLEQAWKMSSEFPVFLFKHSTRCGISHHALHELVNWYSNSEKKVIVYFLDLITYRPLSNAISDKSGVPHQSPQLICIVNGEAVNAISHTSIEESQINRFYNKVLPLTEGNG